MSIEWTRFYRCSWASSTKRSAIAGRSSNPISCLVSCPASRPASRPVSSLLPGLWAARTISILETQSAPLSRGSHGKEDDKEDDEAAQHANDHKETARVVKGVLVDKQLRIPGLFLDPVATVGPLQRKLLSARRLAPRRQAGHIVAPRVLVVLLVPRSVYTGVKAQPARVVVGDERL
jgi:hypothetical protein